MTHKLVIDNLDDHEAEHIAQILASYKPGILVRQIDAMVNKDQGYVDWFDQHLEWHDSVLAKMKWSKN